MLIIFAVGAIGGLLSGLLGIGGAVVMLPLLTTFAGLSLQQASNITIVQVVATSLVSWLVYNRGRLVHLHLAAYMGAASALGGLITGYNSRGLSSQSLEWIFLGVVVSAIALLFIPIRELPTNRTNGTNGTVMPGFNRWLVLSLGGGVGGLAGLLGAGGGFLIVPVMVGVLGLPIRLAVGSSPAVILVSASFAFAGKAISGQIEPLPAAMLVLGAVPSAYLGARFNPRLPAHTLRLLLGGTLVLIAARGVALLFM